MLSGNSLGRADPLPTLPFARPARTARCRSETCASDMTERAAPPGDACFHQTKRWRPSTPVQGQACAASRRGPHCAWPLRLGSDSGVDHLDFVGGESVMVIDLRGLGVGTADEFLERAERDLAGGGRLGSEGVAEAVEANGPGAGVVAGDLEALGDLA